MIPPRIVSSTPPPKRLFPPLPDEVLRLLSEPEQKEGEVAEPAVPASPERPPATARVRWPLVGVAAAEGLLLLWTSYATLVLVGVPLPAW